MGCGLMSYSEHLLFLVGGEPYPSAVDVIGIFKAIMAAWNTATKYGMFKMIVKINFSTVNNQRL